MALLWLCEGLRWILIQVSPQSARPKEQLGQDKNIIQGRRASSMLNQCPRHCSYIIKKFGGRHFKTIKCHRENQFYGFLHTKENVFQLHCEIEADLCEWRSTSSVVWNVRVPVLNSVDRVEMLISCRSSSVSVWKRRMEEPSEKAIHTPPPAHAMCETLTIGSGWTSNFCNGNNSSVTNNSSTVRKCNQPRHQQITLVPWQKTKHFSPERLALSGLLLWSLEQIWPFEGIFSK